MRKWDLRNYTEVLVYRSFTLPKKIPLVKGAAHVNKKPFGIKIKVFVPILIRRRWRNRGFSNFTYVIVAVYVTTFESLIMYRNTRRPCYAVYSFTYSTPLPSTFLYIPSLCVPVEEAYTAAMYSMARLNNTAAKLMHSHGMVLQPFYWKCMIACTCIYVWNQYYSLLYYMYMSLHVSFMHVLMTALFFEGNMLTYHAAYHVMLADTCMWHLMCQQNGFTTFLLAHDLNVSLQLQIWLKLLKAIVIRLNNAKMGCMTFMIHLLGGKLTSGFLEVTLVESL